MNFSDRPAVKRRIVEVLQAAAGLEGVQVSYAAPQQSKRNESIWLGNPDGNREVVDFGAPRQGSDDIYTVPLAVGVAGAASEEDAERRCQELIDAVDVALFSGARLGPSFPALYPGRLDGPAGYREPNSPPAAIAELTIEVHAHVRGARS